MSSGFISEKDLEEARQRRQEEWEKVRNEEQPLECPEEPYDGRSLFDRLREQKMKKDMEYEEAHKLKNLIRGLNDDEVQFLELVDQNKIDAEKKQILEEEKEMKEFRSRVATLQEESADKKIQTELKQTANKTTKTINSRPSQKALLGVSIKRKHDATTATKNDANNENVVSKNDTTSNSASNINISDGNAEATKHTQLQIIKTNEFDCGALKCVAILPGIGPYKESSDSEISSGSEDDPEECGKYDLVGRTIKKKKVCEEEC